MTPPHHQEQMTNAVRYDHSELEINWYSVQQLKADLIDFQNVNNTFLKLRP